MNADHDPRVSTTSTAPTLSRNDSTSTSYTNNEFFKALYLDSPSIALSLVEHPDNLGSEHKQTLSPPKTADSDSSRGDGLISGEATPESDTEPDTGPDSAVPLTHQSDKAKVRGTKPLRVRKKKGAAIVRRVASSRRRGSTLSVPRSPRSPRSPLSLTMSPLNTSAAATNTMLRPIRKPSSASTASSQRHPHATISRLFLSLPAPSPSPTIMSHSNPPESQTLQNLATNDIKRDKRSSGSSLHLGLGRFHSYDPILPGPSPPASPALSPTTRDFNSGKQQLYLKKGPPLPPSPLTPSRAPRKAAKLLGTEQNTSFSRSDHKGGKTRSAARHFRPLPHATKVELERFFGDVPRKMSKTPPGLKKPPSRSRSTGTGGETLGAPLNLEDRKVGEGKTVGYKGDDGNMWMDVEEEQEFAWLMSDLVQSITLDDVDVGENDMRRGRVVVDEVDNQKWGMETFTSVLNLSKPKGSNGYTTLGKSRGQKEKINNNNNNASEDSFLDLGLDFDLPRKVARPQHPFVSSSITPRKEASHPWSKKPKTGLLPPNKLSISPPIPTLIPPTRTSSKMPVLSSSSPGSTDDSESDLSTSPSFSTTISPGLRSNKDKRRPPPLTLPKPKPNARLPILTPTTPTMKAAVEPSRTRSKTISIQRPNTPFTKPRTAPRAPSNPSARIPVPPMSISINIPTSQVVAPVPMSVFEPVTPVEDAPIAVGKKGRGWLKRVVRDFGGVKV
nr:uncharacterized protein CI109_001915 [Kwoniella shandongensis]KAA5529490.1 hypothetical protein CI109_001915 [Kwoniella shandongensis]